MLGPVYCTHISALYDSAKMPETIVETVHTTQLQTHDLLSKWPLSKDLLGNSTPFRFEGELSDLVVFGEIPSDITGTFYRVSADPFVPPDPRNVPLDGDGFVSAFRFRNGKVSLRTRYVNTERHKLEKAAGRNLFGLYRNPFSHHPCVRAAIDSVANTNIIPWAGKILALKEGGLPYELNPQTLETIRYDPFAAAGIKSKTFTAHPKYDAFRDELVCYGYEATGLGSDDIVVYALDRLGRLVTGTEIWIKSHPFVGPIHDCAITENFVVLVMWPFDNDIERMKQGGHHWAWRYDLPATMIVVSRHAESGKSFGWGERERYRVYTHDNIMCIHTGGAYEVQGKIFMDTTRFHDNAFPFFPAQTRPAQDPVIPALSIKADFVRWFIDPSKASMTRLSDPEVLLNIPAEFPRTDERFFTKQSRYTWLNTSHSKVGVEAEKGFDILNGLSLFDEQTRTLQTFLFGENSTAQEPIFIPRSESEGDGWVMSMAEKRDTNTNELVIMDAKDLSKPIAIVQLPFKIKAQVHGNWVEGGKIHDEQ